MFRKFSSRHRSIDLLCSIKFREIWPTDEKSVKSCVIYLTKKTKFRLTLQLSLLRASRPKSVKASLPIMYSGCSRFYSNWFTFGGVIAERVNTAKTRRKVNPIFGWSIASSRIKMFTSCSSNTDFHHLLLHLHDESQLNWSPRWQAACNVLKLQDNLLLYRFSLKF